MLASQLAIVTLMMLARAKQLKAFLREWRCSPERDRLSRDRPSVNGPRYPPETAREADVTGVGCSLSMNERQNHPSR